MGNFDVCKAKAAPEYYEGDKRVISQDDRIFGLLIKGKVGGKSYQPPCDSKEVVVLASRADNGAFKIVEEDKKTKNYTEVEVRADGTTFRSEVVATERTADGIVKEYDVRLTEKTANFFGNDKSPIQKMKKLLEARSQSGSSGKA